MTKEVEESCDGNKRIRKSNDNDMKKISINSKQQSTTLDDSQEVNKKVSVSKLLENMMN